MFSRQGTKYLSCLGVPRDACGLCLRSVLIGRGIDCRACRLKRRDVSGLVIIFASVD